MEVYISEHALIHGVGPEDIEHAWKNFIALRRMRAKLFS